MTRILLYDDDGDDGDGDDEDAKGISVTTLCHLYCPMMMMWMIAIVMRKTRGISATTLCHSYSFMVMIMEMRAMAPMKIQNV